MSEDFPVVFNPQQKFHQLQRVSEKFDEHARAPPVYGNTKDFYSNPLYCIDESARCENVSRKSYLYLKCYFILCFTAIIILGLENVGNVNSGTFRC